ncbi:MAG: hypothetical protein VX300_07820 [Acidobacteriota bacterium]|nr:hypothetical protein [Acidobacteriota bacterium]
MFPWEGTIEKVGSVITVLNPNSGIWDDAPVPPLRFEPDGLFGGPETQIEGIAAAIVDANSNVYIYDNHRHELVSMDPEGTILWRAGREGKGPGEFSAVRGAAYDGDKTIYLVNQEGTRLDAWKTNGTLSGNVELAELGIGKTFMGGFLPPNRVALLADDVFSSATNAYIIVELGDAPRVTHNFQIGTDPLMPIPPGLVLQLSHYFDDDRIFVGTWERYLLREYDDAGKLQRRVTRPVKYLRRPGFAARGTQFAAISFGGLGAPIVLPTGHWIVVASWPTNVDDSNAYVELPPQQRPAIQWSSSIDLFDPEGRFLYSLETPGSPVPAIGGPWATDTEGRLYTVIAQPFPQVRRYRVVIDPPQ